MITVVANLKGGVGKTSIAAALGGCFSADGERTLLIDLDPQGSLSRHFGFTREQLEPGTQNLFDDEPLVLSDCQRASRFTQLDVVPTASRLTMVERRAGVVKGLGLLLSRALAEDTLHDQVVIDCAPQAGLLLVNALAAADRIVLPVQTEYLALEGLKNILRTLKMLEQSQQRSRKYLIVPTMYDRRTRASRLALEDLRREYADHLWSGMIPVDTQFREASRAHVPLPLFRPNSAGARACRELTDYLRADWQLERDVRMVG